MALFGKWFSQKPGLDAERARQLIERAVRKSKEPQGAAKMALHGAETRQQLLKLIEQCETETGEGAIVFAQKEGVMLAHPKLLELIRKDTNGPVLEPALFVAFTTADTMRRFNEVWPPTVAKYHNRANSDDLVDEKSVALAGFVTSNLGVGVTIYSELHPTAQLLNDEQETLVKLEEAALWYRVVDELAYRYINRQRLLFIEQFEDNLAHLLGLQGAPTALICDTMFSRSREYAGYRKWMPEGEEGAKGTLLWEAAKHVGAPFDGARDPMFLLAFGGRFLLHLRQAFVFELLTGEEPNQERMSKEGDSA